MTFTILTTLFFALIVLREVTTQLLSQQFFQYVLTTFTDEIISMSQVRILMSDIATCSLMRLDAHSLDKLLDLMIMIFKWQMFLISHPDELLNVTLRHLNGIGRLIPEQGKMILIDQTNQFIYNHWKALRDEQKMAIMRKFTAFLAPFNVRISILIRMRLQLRDGTFLDRVAASSNDFFRYYVQNLGENVYEKVNLYPHCQVVDTRNVGRQGQTSSEIDCLFHQLNMEFEGNTFEFASEKSEEKKEEAEQEVKVEEKNGLEELKRKCKFDVMEEAPPAYEDNFDELLNMLEDTKN